MESLDSAPLLSEDGGAEGRESPLLEEPVSVDKVEEELGVQFEAILEKIGGFGRYQKWVIFCVVLPMFFASSFMQSSWVSEF